MNMEEIIIQKSKRKIGFIILGAIALIGVSVWILMNPEAGILKKLTGVIGLVFFGSLLPFLLKIFFENKPGLIINSKGIWNNSNAFHIGIIEWNDIISFSELEISSAKMINIQLENDKKYIDRCKNPLLRFVMKMNRSTFYSSVSISLDGLSIKPVELMKILQDYHEKIKNK